jgi:hypothetical protein
MPGVHTIRGSARLTAGGVGTAIVLDPASAIVEGT